MLPIDFLVYSLSLWELIKVVLWSKALGMSSAFYLVAVLEVLVGDLIAVTLLLNANKHVKLTRNWCID